MEVEAVVAIVAVFGMPPLIVWLKYRYKALEKGLIKPRQTPLFVLGSKSEAAGKDLDALRQEKKLLEERVRNLESIVCSVDLELNARLNRLAAQPTALAPALPSGGTLAATGQGLQALGVAPTLAIGQTVLGRYRIERELGRGGMGAVFLARDAQLGELVALKIVRTQLGGGDSAQAAERFRREASAARKITHPNVIRIFDLDEDPATGELLLSMEYFAGKTLGEILGRRGALPLDEARDLLGQICDGLGAAHAAGVIHRDLKPGNVLVNERREAKLIDFGLAQASFLAGMTATGLILGTPEYMAPEQVRGRPVDARTDLYAVGAVAYHLVTGVPPFSGETPIAIGFAHCTQPVRPPRELRAELPESLSTAIIRALAKEPRDRFASADELRKAFLG